MDKAFADDNFGEVARLLYDAIWAEFCDWGLELAKVRLGDATLADADREATWWTLVDALDTYLRLLHPVMPFVTEALWAVLPHAANDPELLVVADWPTVAAGTLGRDLGLEASVRQVLDLVAAARTARATAGIAASAWLPMDVVVPASERSAFDSLVPAVERLARVRPITIVRDRDALDAAPDGSLGIVAGALDARLHAATTITADDRARIEKELAQAEAALAATRARLSDSAFVDRAPAAIVDGARARAIELEERVERLRASVR